MEKQKRPIKRSSRRGSSRTALTQSLAKLIEKHPEILPILDRYGVSFCAGCYLTLSKTPKQAAAYHAVPNPIQFVEELRRIINS